jgi:hypothetical protein
MNEFFNNSSATIFPNPASGNLFIDFENKDFGKAEISLRNILGETLLNENRIGNGKQRLDVSALSNGIYFLQMKTEYGIATKKIVISR